ncbi:next to BRCA1 gene 1 protein-like isoform X2 [Lethenteron reissneri]|uniref:next to BRCA1 gene 1 protein-like isoform X2 n=1 Tax=Lethenteron reissneri TaxID=7753 RepID=UPI002AB6B3B6|nr:next to BRCA1 gene 1 protein-like isoform X2 [Lethenteron reissneri]
MEGTVRLDVHVGARGTALTVGLGCPWRDVGAMILASFGLASAHYTYLDEDNEEVSIDTEEEYGEALKVACADGYVLHITVHNEESSSGTDDSSSGNVSVSSSSTTTTTSVQEPAAVFISQQQQQQQQQHYDEHRHRHHHHHHEKHHHHHQPHHHHHHHKHHQQQLEQQLQQHLQQHQQQIQQHQQQIQQHQQQVLQFQQQAQQQQQQAVVQQVQVQQVEEQHQQQVLQFQQQVQQQQQAVVQQFQEQHQQQVLQFQQQAQPQQQAVVQQVEEQQQQQQQQKNQVDETPLVVTQRPDVDGGGSSSSGGGDDPGDVDGDGAATGGGGDGFPVPPGTPPPWFQEYMEKFREKVVMDVTVRVTKEVRKSLARELAGGVPPKGHPPGNGAAKGHPPGNGAAPPDPRARDSDEPDNGAGARDAKQRLRAEKELLRLEKQRLRAEKKQRKAEFREIKRQLSMQRYGRAWAGVAVAAGAPAGVGAAGGAKKKREEEQEEKEENFEEAAAAAAAAQLVAPSHIPALACVNAVFVEENLPDGTHVQPEMRFIKHWRMCNTGNMAWDSRTTLQLLWGNLCVAVSTGREVSVPFLAPGSTGTLSVEFVAPAAEGTYTSHWRLAHEGRPFGPRVWVTVVVADPPMGPEAHSSPTHSLYSDVRNTRKDLSFELLLPVEEQKVPSNTPVAVSPRASPLPDDAAVLLESESPHESRAEEELSGTDFVFETVIRSLTLEESPEPRPQPRRDTRRHGSPPAPLLRPTPIPAATKTAAAADDDDCWHDALAGPPGGTAPLVARGTGGGGGREREEEGREDGQARDEHEDEEDGGGSQSSDDFVVVLPECFDTSRPLSLEMISSPGSSHNAPPEEEEEDDEEAEERQEGGRGSRRGGAAAVVAEGGSEVAEEGGAATGGAMAEAPAPAEGTVDEMLWGPPAGGAVPLTPLALHGGPDGAQLFEGDGDGASGPPGGERAEPLGAPRYINSALTLASSAIRAMLRVPAAQGGQGGQGVPVAVTPTAMRTLLEMGFGDRTLNARLLQEHAGDLNAVVPALLAANDDGWHRVRH